ncbi:MAG: CoA-binding protein [Candidatus Heimdallarchaeota archaeon]|nr:MAG: CoA-binding protein [Candidatus Heimdallarchaeota archaeon]
MSLNLDRFFNPRAVALVGASDKLSSWGFIVAHNIVQNDFTGEFFPVHPKKEEILGYKAYTSILEIPKDVQLDLVIIIIPARYVLSILEQAKQRGVHHVVIITAGFKESGEEGRILEEKITAFARENGIRLIGPNGMGVVSTRVNLTAVMWPVTSLKSGGMAFVSQSGNIGTIGLTVASRRGIGLNVYVSAGNMADLTMSDYLEYFGKQDSKTKVIGLYIEGIQDPRRFVKLVKEISKEKPVIILKAGGTSAGSRAALSHTGAITGDDHVFRDILEHAGAIIVDSLDEMFDLVLVFSRWAKMKFPRGRIVIVTRGGGWGVMAADACSRQGINLEPLSNNAYERIDKLLPEYWSKGNPIDTVASLNLNDVKEIIKIVFDEMPLVEAIFLLGVGGIAYLANLAKKSPFIQEEQMDQLDFISNIEVKLFEDILELSESYNKPILITTLLTAQNSPSIKFLESQDYPIFPTPARMVHAFRYMVNFYRWRQRI